MVKDNAGNLLRFEVENTQIRVFIASPMDPTSPKPKPAAPQGFDERDRATPRADIWIPRPEGSVCRDQSLTGRSLLADIAADFTHLRLRVPG
jgi:hypothetical protein